MQSRDLKQELEDRERQHQAKQQQEKSRAGLLPYSDQAPALTYSNEAAEEVKQVTSLRDVDLSAFDDDDDEASSSSDEEEE